LSGRKIRGPRFYLDYEYESDTKDQIEDLLTEYPSALEVITEAISVLHKQHFGSSSDRSPPPKYSETLATTDPNTSKRLDELHTFIQTLKEDIKHLVPVETETKNQTDLFQLSDEANEKILEKIEDLGMKFSKIMPKEEKAPKGQKKQVTAEMSNEEVLQLIKRIDQMESKLTRAISQSRTATGPATTGVRRSGGLRDLGDAPKIGAAKPIEGPPPDQDRPLLDDVLETIIVSTEADET